MRLRIEVAGGLVGDDEPRASRERGTQCDPLLLAAGQLPGQSVRAIEQADALEQLARTCPPFGSGRRGEPQRDGDQLLSGQFARKGTPVVLIRVPETSRR